ncbi:hypothetical protein [Ferrimonas marina]|uniref:Uncharacterized protein n=1 Tax=Ferrimonas marina TaxID=299255 RepID=A0A1M5TZI6_9GAMM|nr:hypothetical protein [Ferrimonas marina]SHH56041.1 hypothetical protein SAMN02745129_2339 [Ferrimonas marina]
MIHPRAQLLQDSYDDAVLVFDALSAICGLGALVNIVIAFSLTPAVAISLLAISACTSWIAWRLWMKDTGMTDAMSIRARLFCFTASFILTWSLHLFAPITALLGPVVALVFALPFVHIDRKHRLAMHQFGGC